MTRLLASPKLFAATGVLFAVGTFLNFASGPNEDRSAGLRPAPAYDAPADVKNNVPAPKPAEITKVAKAF